MTTAQFWIYMVAIIAGPILAVQAEKWLARRREEQGRKLWLFRELMATRAARLSARHVEALNLIELEYSAAKKTQRRVHEAWRSYFDTLGLPVDPQNPQAVFDKRDSAFVDLLYEMAQCLR